MTDEPTTMPDGFVLIGRTPDGTEHEVPLIPAMWATLQGRPYMPVVADQPEPVEIPQEAAAEPEPEADAEPHDPWANAQPEDAPA